ncbi:MAG: NUDIX hydrolase [Opitutales bacterium]|nr:NUDIX hydrolase [Opitutales bacterium]
MDSAAENAPKLWKKSSEKIVADCKVFKVFEERFAHPDGREGDFYICKSNSWVQTAAITKEGKIVLVNQFRFGVEKCSWEFSGGIIENGEDAVSAALRELEEETGYAAESAELAAEFSPNPAIQNNKAYVVIAKNCEKKKALSWDENEEIQTMEASPDELDKMVARGQIHHSIAICGIYFLKKYLEKNA